MDRCGRWVSPYYYIEDYDESSMAMLLNSFCDTTTHNIVMEYLEKEKKDITWSLRCVKSCMSFIQPTQKFIKKKLEGITKFKDPINRDLIIPDAEEWRKIYESWNKSTPVNKKIQRFKQRAIQ